ncbi:MAG: hypothetical protein SO179_09440 [Bacteroidales bacterium]|nr:hypothetical protein [Bacteroidales bacterium]
MKKIKQMRLKATLLAIVAVLSLGFTSCTDELGSDPTQGKPGYLTINLKTLQPKQTKLATIGADDFKEIKDLNIFVLNSDGIVLIHKYYANSGEWTGTAGTATVAIPVNAIVPSSDYVVAVANYNSSIAASSIGAIQALNISTVRDVETHGLHMTGRADIKANGTAYESQVKIAPVESKITVKWGFTNGLDTLFNVTGVYVVNAITNTKLPLIRNNTYDTGTSGWNPSNISPTTYINYSGNTTGTTRTAATGFNGTMPGNWDFNLYTTLTPDNATTPLLRDESATGLTSGLHYYVGENYSNNSAPAYGMTTTIDNANATVAHANTIVIIKVTPNTTGAAIHGGGDRYYTYEFDKNSTGTLDAALNPYPANNSDLGSITEGFSVRRKTNYNLTFNLTSIGATEPFRRIKTLNVTVVAEPWDNQGVTPTF